MHENAYAVCVEGVSCGVFEILPEEYGSLPLYDYGDALIFPGMVDLHVHAPQYAFRGMCMDLELMEELRQIQMAYGIPVQSHLSESKGEIEFVKLLRPDNAFYGDSLAERMERAVYLGLDEKRMTAKFVAGRKII